MTISRKGARAKGRDYQSNLALRWRESGLFPNAWSGISQSRGGDECPDVTGCDDFWIECKFNKKSAPWAALQQAEENTQDGKTPIAVLKQNRTGEMVVMRLDTFEKLVAKGRK